MWRKKYDSLLFTFLLQFNKLSYSTGTFLDLKEKYSYTFSALLHAFGHNLTYLLNISIISLFQVLNSIFNGIYNSTYFTYVDNSKNVYMNTLLICLLKKRNIYKNLNSKQHSSDVVAFSFSSEIEACKVLTHCA